ncbi:hypothetical protein J6590_030925 [Homalodisca vitripennis]|nr:hypothetical protein J6590_030925 [Homalodisca vitripennis]
MDVKESVFQKVTRETAPAMMNTPIVGFCPRFLQTLPPLIPLQVTPEQEILLEISSSPSSCLHGRRFRARRRKTQAAFCDPREPGLSSADIPVCWFSANAKA